MNDEHRLWALKHIGKLWHEYTDAVDRLGREGFASAFEWFFDAAPHAARVTVIVFEKGVYVVATFDDTVEDETPSYTGRTRAAFHNMDNLFNASDAVFRRVYGPAGALSAARGEAPVWTAYE